MLMRCVRWSQNLSLTHGCGSLKTASQVCQKKANEAVETPVDEQPPELPEAVELVVDTVLDETVFNAWLAKLKAADLFAFDTETTSLYYTKAEVVGVSFAVAAGHAAYVPLAHHDPAVPNQLSREWVLEQLKPLLESAEVHKVGQNLKYDANVLMNHGICLQGMRHDTMLESYVLNSTATRHDSGFVGRKIPWPNHYSL